MTITHYIGETLFSFFLGKLLCYFPLGIHISSLSIFAFRNACIPYLREKTSVTYYLGEKLMSRFSCLLRYLLLRMPSCLLYIKQSYFCYLFPLHSQNNFCHLFPVMFIPLPLLSILQWLIEERYCSVHFNKEKAEPSGSRGGHLTQVGTRWRPDTGSSYPKSCLSQISS
jgi:hypothetical protein